MKYNKTFKLKPGMSKDGLRPALTGALFTGEYLVVTNGHIVGKIKVERTNIEAEIANEALIAGRNIVIPNGAISLFEKGKNRAQCEYEDIIITRKNIMVKKLGSFTGIFKQIPEAYPDYEKVFESARPGSKENKKKEFIKIGINPGLLKDLADVLGCESVELHIQKETDGTDPIYVRERTRKDYEGIEAEPNEGIIMPVRLDKCTE